MEFSCRNRHCFFCNLKNWDTDELAPNILTIAAAFVYARALCPCQATPLPNMVGTRSRAPDSSAIPEDDVDAKEPADQSHHQQHQQQSPQRQTRSSVGGTSLERLPKPATSKGKSSSLRDGTGGGSNGSTIASRYSARAGGSHQIDGEGRRLPTRTSLESLPRPRAAAPASPSRRAAGRTSSTPPRRGARGSENSHTRTNAELTALRGQDAAVSEICGDIGHHFSVNHSERYHRTKAQHGSPQPCRINQTKAPPKSFLKNFGCFSSQALPCYMYRGTVYMVSSQLSSPSSKYNYNYNKH